MKYVLYWNGSSKPEVVEGSSIANAFTLAGFGAGAIAALDYYAPVKEKDNDLSDEKLIEKYKV